MHRILTTTVICLFLTACDFSTHVSHRSGTANDDYIEEPLAAGAKRYETALQTSNELMALLQQGQYSRSYTYLEADIKATVSAEQFSQLMDQVTLAVGPMQHYKPMQWHFYSGSEQGVELLYSRKIAEHDRARLNYLFVFRKDGDYRQLLGVHTQNY